MSPGLFKPRSRNARRTPRPVGPFVEKTASGKAGARSRSRQSAATSGGYVDLFNAFNSRGVPISDDRDLRRVQLYGVVLADGFMQGDDPPRQLDHVCLLAVQVERSIHLQARVIQQLIDESGHLLG